MRQALAFVAVLALAAAGCSTAGSGEESEPADRATSPGLPPDVERAFAGFLEAAASESGDVTQHLSAASRERGARPAAALHELARAGGYAIVVAEPISLDWAVGAIAWGEEAHAVPLRLEEGAWKVELGGPVRLRALAPDPGAEKGTHAQVAVEITAEAPIGFGVLFVDGRNFPTKEGGPNLVNVTVFGSPGALAPGIHVVVAFAQAGEDSAATAWTFRVRDEA